MFPRQICLVESVHLCMTAPRAGSKNAVTIINTETSELSRIYQSSVVDITNSDRQWLYSSSSVHVYCIVHSATQGCHPHSFCILVCSILFTGIAHEVFYSNPTNIYEL